jgi:threonine aldolase
VADELDIDLRSDTVTRPDAGMRRAMAEAEVGDDVFGDDPTVNALQERVARLLGKEAALFTPSGTMANQLALRSQTQPGDEILLDRAAHMVNYESGAAAVLSGVQLRTFDSPAGGFGSAELRGLRRPSQYWLPRSRLVEMENTHNGRGGEVFRLERMREVFGWAESVGLRVHLDGARLWNASVASGVPLQDYAACAHTVSVCFSKGLGAPVGSALAGEADTIRRAHRLRKMLGGGMRQVGVLAAAALYGLDRNFERLADDHRKATLLARAVERCSGLRLAAPVETNILIIEVVNPEDTPAAVVEALAREGVRAAGWDERRLRLVTHLDVSLEDAERAAEILVRVRG